jgi:hypothetical protein
LNFLYLGVLGDLAVRFLLIIKKLPLQGRGWRSGYGDDAPAAPRADAPATPVADA